VQRTLSTKKNGVRTLSNNRRSAYRDSLFGRRTWRTLLKQRELFLMMLIPAVIFVLFHYVPITKITWAFTNYGEVPASKVTFNGWDNFVRLFRLSAFKRAFRNTLIINGMKLLFYFPVPIFIALLLNEIGAKRYKGTVQTVIYFPHFLSWVVVGSIWFVLLAPQNSVNAQISELLGVEPIYFFADRRYIRGILVASDIWQGAGYGAILYLAALTSISPELYESAIVDGAGKFRQIWHITLPGIRSTIVILFILKVSDLLEIFEQVLVMAKPIVRDVTDVIDLYAYRTGISEMQLGYAMSVSVFKAVIAFLLVLGTNRLARALGEEGVF
jgi:ABC-type polysaccharide transport system permease subunit